MKKLSLVLLSLAVAAVTACTVNVKKEATHKYNVPLKKANVAVVQSLQKNGFKIKSSASPAEGMSVINAIEATGDNPLLSRRPVEVNISIFEAEPNWVTIETVGIMEGAATDWGITEGVVSQLYKDLETRLQ